MTQNDTQNSEEARSGDETSRQKTKIIVSVDNLEDVDKAVRGAFGKSKDAVSGVGESIRETIKTVRATRDSVVMVRVSTDSLNKIDELVDSGLTNSRSEAAAFLIAEGIEARADLYDKIAEQTEVIRSAREKLHRLLKDEPDTQP